MPSKRTSEEIIEDIKAKTTERIKYKVSGMEGTSTKIRLLMWQRFQIYT
jgi:hypothetical protein